MLLGIQGMCFRNSLLSVILAAFSGVFPSNELRAEFLCSTDISYTWVKSAAGGGVSGTPAPSAAPKPTIIRYSGVQRLGRDEAGAKANLQIEVNRQKGRASDACKRDHESMGDCMATKLSSKASVLNSLGFSARAELEKALQEECKAQQGVCLSVEAAEPQCRDITPAKAADGGSAGKKSDPKKPESKKK